MKMNIMLILALAMPMVMINGNAADTKVAPEISKAFFADLAQKAADAEKANVSVIRGKDNWLFISSELKSLGVGAEFWGENAAKVSHIATPDAQDSLAAIVDFKKQCDKAGVELIMVPVPGKAIIYPEMISETVKSFDGTVPRLDIYHEKFYSILKENGVKVLDLTPAFLQHRNDVTGGMFCHTDTHWSPQACVLVAKMLGDDIKTRPWYKAVAKKKYEVVNRDAEVTGDLAGMLADPAIGKEKLKMTVVQERTAAGLASVDTWRESPIVLLGDSHNLIFHGGDDMLYVGAGLMDNLAMQLNFPVDLVAVRGSGATSARKNLARRKDNLTGKKLVIWCFTAREFTEGQGWSKVNVVK
jgi:hypothetical protein